MLLIILILTAILIGLIVYLLRKDQQRRYAEIVDQGQHLPPIDLYEQIEEITASDTPAADAESAIMVATEATESVPVSTIAQPLKEHGNEREVLSWKKRCKLYRGNNQFEQALAAAQEAWPQWQAYEQTAITLRASIKSHHNLIENESTLRQLYRNAAEASYLYDRRSGQPTPRWQTIAQSTSRQRLNQLSYDWQNLGYLHLKLLNTTDIRNMTKLWGEPKQHLSPISP